MQEQQKQLVDRLKQAQNILVTVSANPSVDQLAAAIGLTLALNHLDKHATAVFSGEVPSTLEFLQPGETLEKNTDSLRDFIIALDKSKADKLRYKVEDNVVRIFITPYRSSISEKDLDFSQGDFNVDVVLALGVHEQQDLDAAITAHGRILHDATVAAINTETNANLGTLNWVNSEASSLSEMVVNLVDALDKKVIDSQIATALLTGIVASTERFRNDKTSPKTMSASAELMAAGANQQLIATQLETPPEPVNIPGDSDQNGTDDKDSQADSKDSDIPKEESPEQKKPEPGTLEIEHEADDEKPEEESLPSATVPFDSEPEQPQPQVHVDENGRLVNEDQEPEEALPGIGRVRGVSNEGQPTESDGLGLTAGEKPENVVLPPDTHERITEAPEMTGQLTANTEPEELDPASEELTLPPVDTPPVMDHGSNAFAPAPADFRPSTEPPTPQPVPDQPVVDTKAANNNYGDRQAGASSITPGETLSEIEQAVSSTHLNQPEPSALPTKGVDAARDAVEVALGSATDNPTAPIEALNAQPLGEELHGTPNLTQPPLTPIVNSGFSESTPGNTPADEALDMPMPGSASFGTLQSSSPSAFPGAPQPSSNQGVNPNAPPPVPPPMLPPLQ